MCIIWKIATVLSGSLSGSVTTGFSTWLFLVSKSFCGARSFGTKLFRLPTTNGIVVVVVRLFFRCATSPLVLPPSCWSRGDDESRAIRLDMVIFGGLFFLCFSIFCVHNAELTRPVCFKGCWIFKYVFGYSTFMERIRSDQTRFVGFLWRVNVQNGYDFHSSIFHDGLVR